MRATTCHPLGNEFIWLAVQNKLLKAGDMTICPSNRNENWMVAFTFNVDSRSKLSSAHVACVRPVIISSIHTPCIYQPCRSTKHFHIILIPNEGRHKSSFFLVPWGCRTEFASKGKSGRQFSNLATNIQEDYM